MPFPLLRLLVLVAATVSWAGYAAGQTAPTGAAPAAPVQETAVHGTPPDLAGRWLSLAWVELAEGKIVTGPALWEVKENDGKPVVTQRFVSLPPALKEALDKANAEQERWQPSAADVAEIRAQWDSLAPEDAKVAKVTNDISARDDFDDTIKKEPRSKDALWVLRQRQDFDASAAPVIRQASVYAALASSGADYTGNFDTVTVAAAPIPVPLTFKGTFRFYRLDEPAQHPRGFLARLLDFFAGCGRRQPSG